MPLRTRLAAALLAVAVGTVVVGAVLAGGLATQEDGRARAEERLTLAAAATHTAVAALCDRLRAAAVTVTLQAPDQRERAAQELIARGLVDHVELRTTAGTARLPAGASTGTAADCDAPEPGAATGARYQAIAAGIVLHAPDGGVEGQVWAAVAVDEELVHQWAAAARADVTVLGPEGAPLHSTDHEAARTAAAALGLPPGTTGESGTGRWVQRLAPVTDQPLPLVVSLPRTGPRAGHLLLTGVALLSGLLAVGAVGWAARAVTRTLRQFAHVTGRPVAGDPADRVPVPLGDAPDPPAAAGTAVQGPPSSPHAVTTARDQLHGQLALLGEALASTHDLDGLVRVILRSALTAGSARSGAVALLDPATGELVGHRADRGEHGRVTPVPLRVPAGEGLLGAVAATGRVKCGRVEPGQTWLHPAEPACHTYLAVPIATPQDTGAPPGPAVRGVLALYDRVGADAFDEEDVTALRTFAAQAAVAVDNVRSHEEAERLSLTDPLTGLWNYRSLRESLRREVERASRFRRTLTVLALDLDRFKEVNDAYGHPAGDAVLVELTRRIRAEIRNMDFVFRQGGEEFVVLLPEAGVEGGTVVAQRLGAAVRSRPVLIDSWGTDGPVRVAITVSIGIAVFPDHARTPQEVLDAADDALYAAKAAGRDTYRVATRRPAPVVALELPVRTGACTPEQDLPRAGNDMGISGGAQPPRQNRGR